jgi:hypothetical protein
MIKFDKRGNVSIAAIIFFILFLCLLSSCVESCGETINKNPLECTLVFLWGWGIITTFVLIIGIADYNKFKWEKAVLKKFILRCFISYALLVFMIYWFGFFSDTSVKFMEDEYTVIQNDFLDIIDNKEVSEAFNDYVVTEGDVHNRFINDTITYYVKNEKFNTLTVDEMCKYFRESKLYYGCLLSATKDDLSKALTDTKRSYSYYRSTGRYSNDYFCYEGVICGDNVYSMVILDNNEYGNYCVLYINSKPVCRYNYVGIIAFANDFVNDGYFEGDMIRNEEAYKKAYPPYTESSSGSSSNYSSKSNNYSGYSYTPSYNDDPYNVYDYDDPEDFYYDNEDDFEDYEDAEDYYYDARDE